MDHPPRFLAHGLPHARALTVDDLDDFPPDAFWKYELIDGTLFVSSDGYQITATDLEELPKQAFWKYELVDGILVVTPNAPSERHQSCVGSLYLLLRQACPAHLKVLVAPFEYRPPPSPGLAATVMSTQPDLLVAARPIPDKRLVDPPILAVEVLSPSSRRSDRTFKRNLYAELGVLHYWLVDPQIPSVQLLQLSGGKYREIAGGRAGQQVSVTDPIALRFDPRDLLDE